MYKDPNKNGNSEEENKDQSTSEEIILLDKAYEEGRSQGWRRTAYDYLNELTKVTSFLGISQVMADTYFSLFLCNMENKDTCVPKMKQRGFTIGLGASALLLLLTAGKQITSAWDYAKVSKSLEKIMGFFKLIDPPVTVHVFCVTLMSALFASFGPAEIKDEDFLIKIALPSIFIALLVSPEIYYPVKKGCLNCYAKDKENRYEYPSYQNDNRGNFQKGWDSVTQALIFFIGIAALISGLVAFAGSVSRPVHDLELEKNLFYQFIKYTVAFVIGSLIEGCKYNKYPPFPAAEENIGRSWRPLLRKLKDFSIFLSLTVIFLVENNTRPSTTPGLQVLFPIVVAETLLGCMALKWFERNSKPDNTQSSPQEYEEDPLLASSYGSPLKQRCCPNPLSSIKECWSNLKKKVTRQAEQSPLLTV